MNQRSLVLIAGLLSCFVLSITSAAADFSVKWEIQNRYRTFDYKADGFRTPKESANLFAKYGRENGESDRNWFSRIAQIESPFKNDSGPWNEERGVYDKDFVELPRYLSLELSIGRDEGSKDQLGQKKCAWQISGRETIIQPCIDPLHLPDFDSRGARVAVFQDGSKIASTEIRPRLIIILGLGDSYASGEGNPDAPTEWRTPKAGEWPPITKTAANELVSKPARWWSNRCDRSFYSYQNFVALWTAFKNPDAVVAFVHLACSGAEVIDGILVPQRYLPGHSIHRCSSPLTREIWDSKCDAPYSQLDAAVELLCRDPKPLEPWQIKHIQASLRDPIMRVPSIQYKPNQVNWLEQKSLTGCSPGQLRKEIDHVFLSVGGNDIGFSGLIAYTLMPSRSGSHIPFVKKFPDFVVGFVQKGGNAVCPYTPGEDDRERKERCGELGLAADIRILDLPQRFEALRRALGHTLHVAPERVVVNLYPNPLRDECGKLCSNPRESNDDNEWNATHLLLPSGPLYKFLHGISPVDIFDTNNWQINLTKGEADDVERHAIIKLNNVIENTLVQNSV